MRLTDRQGAVLYNLGAIISYVSLVMLLLDALHVAKHHEVDARFGFAMSWLIGAILKSPYKWDRLWLQCLDSDSDFSAVAVDRRWGQLITTAANHSRTLDDRRMEALQSNLD